MRNSLGYGTDPMPIEKKILRFERKAARLPATTLPVGCLIYPKDIKAARIIYKWRHGEIPKGLCVCHACDTPRCIEDSHHWLGTNLDNVKDSMAKGRKAISETAKIKMAAAKKGRKLSAEHRAKIAKSNMGRVNSAACRAKLSAKLKGRFMSKEWRDKISSALSGKKLSAEHCAKISAGLTSHYAK